MLAAAAVLVAGCVYEDRPPRERVVVERVPASTQPAASPTTTAEPAPVAEDTVIEEAPPAVQQEVIVERPSPAYVWIGGYWGYQGRHYVWFPGRWELPPRGLSVWVGPRYVRRGRGWAFVRGYWR